MKIAIGGASGMIGKQLVAHLQTRGFHIYQLVRPGRSHTGFDKVSTIVWDPANGDLDKEHLEGLDAVIHLGGETITGTWTETKKKRILDSRVKSTTLLATTMAKLKRKPTVFACASAIGYYDQTDYNRPLDESAPQGGGFLAEVGAAWEAATQPAADAGIRVVNMRIGIVLDTQGGALKEMLTPFKMGVGGVVGSGKQMMSWITTEDVVRAITFCTSNPNLSGPVNLVAPDAATNKRFTKTLGKVLGRPTFIPVPGLAVSLLFGEMGRTLILSGAHVVPRKLEEAGFNFKTAGLEAGLKHALSKA
ncbi:TIGR01777 family oxidoreductase [Acanthopleuribacter pedis]|uniref:TIGR01777 family oxidoreductase n=1 Tax=Acanthopleuribacter pedis TaxID=442870 RepID=A0A8J7U574_9BACT|nr:TIGR01777 family oxidoreductase [Acanthopleuribacter pedis]MBO1320188.1 TIGR01777 family oxidoreductase [Acanthopleuribacter pedis]